MSKFKINDEVVPKQGSSHEDYTFRVTRVTGSSISCYSTKLAKAGLGHDGSLSKTALEQLGIPVGNCGHWSYHEDDLILYYRSESTTKDELSVGDLVRTVDRTHKRAPYTFEILEVPSDSGNYRCFCQEMADAEIGHGGGSHINGVRYGHWNFGKDELELIKTKNSKDEVLRSNSDGCPGGIESKIYSQPVKVASGSRPLGSRTTACRIGITVGTGIVSNNRIQPH